MSDDSTDPIPDASDDTVDEPADVAEAGMEGTDATDVGTDADVPASTDSETETVDDAAAVESGTGEAAAPKVVRKKVTSKRVTPKGSTQGAKVSSSPVTAKARAKTDIDDDDDDVGFSKRYTPPQATYAQGPSPAWVPVLMFGLLIIGALVIMLNYMEVFGAPANIRLVIGLAFILGGIITATQYR